MDPQSTVSAPALIGLRNAIERDGQRRFVLEFVERGMKAREPYVEIWNELWDNYLVVPTGTTKNAEWHGTSLWPAFPNTRMAGMERSVLKDPETHQIIEALAAQSLGLLFSSRDYIQAVPVGADDPEKARLISRLLQAVLEQPGFFRTAYQLFKDAFIFGTSIVELGWETRSRMQYVQQPSFDENGYPAGNRLVPSEVIYRDRPLFRQIDHYDFIPDPSGTRIQEDMIGAAKRFAITPQEARRLARSGTYDDPAAVERAIATMRRPPSTSLDTSPQQRKFDQLVEQLPSRMGLLTGFEYFGEYPDRVSDGMSNRKITLLNGELVAGYGNPFTDGAIPYKEIVVNPVQGRFWGLSPAEVIRYLQDSTDHFMMTLQDAMNVVLRGPLLASRGFGGDIERIRNAKFNDVVEVTDREKIGPVQRDLTILNLAQAELARRKVTMRESQGANSPQQPVPLSGRPTTLEVSEVTRVASQRGEMMTVLIEKDDYPHIGRTLHLRLRQFTEPDSELVGVYGGERFAVTLDDIDIDADVRFIGSRQAQSRFQKFSALKEAYNTLSTNPDAVTMYPELVVRIFRDGLDIADADEIVSKALVMIEKQRALLASQGQQPPPGRPVAGSGTASARSVEQSNAQGSRNA